MSNDQLSRTLAALADPTRRAILIRLEEGQATVNELAELFPISQQAISKHLKVLEQAGLIRREKSAQRRPCRLEVEPMLAAAAWLERFKALATDRFDRLDREIQLAKEGDKND